MTIEAAGVAIVVRFPFGRYAATPWYRSRREHVDNVEWPPSPWRIARALVAVAERHGDGEYVARVVRLIGLLARELPQYALPVTAPLTYTQWMPGLDFGDHVDSTERLDNGHYLLDLDPEAPLRIRWPGVELDPDDGALLADVLAALPFLGQSVAVAEASLDCEGVVDDPAQAVTAVDSSGADPGSLHTRLLAPEPHVTHDDLACDTASGVLKGMQAPPGARWVTYRVPAAPEKRPRVRLPDITRLWLRLDGPLRPPVRRLLDPAIRDERAVTPDRLGRALREAWALSADVRLVALAVDEDGDGRAELLELTVGPDRTLSEGLLRAIAERTGIDRDAVSVTVRGEQRQPLTSLEFRSWIEHVERGAASARVAAMSRRDARPVLWTLEANGGPALTSALPIAEEVHTAILSQAARRFGANAIPRVLSGRGPDGRPLRDAEQHGHKHILAASMDGVAITHLGVWTSSGLTAEERSVIESIHLRHRGRAVKLSPTDEHPAFASAQQWRALTPYLPFNHIKPRGRNSVQGQVARELVEFRGMPAPSGVEVTPRAAGGFRLLRRRDDRRRPLPFDVSITFDDVVAGPIALGRHSHFSIGLFVPAM